jgi:hypothetical protein
VDARGWDQRYAAADLVWPAGPNRTVADQVSGLPPGSALDLACGEGRNALWPAERGWTVTAVDFSSVAIEKARTAAARRGRDVHLLVADVTSWQPDRVTGIGADRVGVFVGNSPAGQYVKGAATSCPGSTAPPPATARSAGLQQPLRQGRGRRRSEVARPARARPVGQTRPPADREVPRHGPACKDSRRWANGDGKPRHRLADATSVTFIANITTATLPCRPFQAR